MTRLKKKTANVDYDGTALRSWDSETGNWKRGAIFEAHEGGFELQVRLPSEGSFTIGICHDETAVSKIAKCGALPRGVGCGFFVYKHGPITGLYVFDRHWKGAHTSAEVRSVPVTGLQAGNTLTMKYESTPERQLALSINEGSFIPVTSEFNEAIADMPYLPFVNLGILSSLEVRVQAANRKKRRRSCDHGTRLWSEREFTDAVIVTATGSIPVHRAILGCCPPLRAALMGGFQESHSCQLTLDDVSHASVEAFLQFLYTGSLPEEIDSVEVLQLAHRYDHKDLIEICAGKAVNAVGSCSVRGVVQALRLLKDDPGVSPAWQRLSEKISSSGELREALMMSI